MRIEEVISKAIKEGKWIDIVYDNKKGEETHYWIAINDIDIHNKKFKVDIFNDKKSFDSIKGKIYFDKIKEAKLISFSSYDVPEKLIEKIDKNLEQLSWLKYDQFNHNILSYYKECVYYDCDPFQAEYNFVDGIDLRVLKAKKVYKLSDIQMKKIINDIYHYDINQNNLKNYTLIINALSIDKGKKKYVVCYHELSFDPSKKVLKIIDDLKFNKSFLVEGRPYSLHKYINMDIDEFIEHFEENKQECFNLIVSNCSHGEMANQNPEVMLLEREIPVDLEETYEEIEKQYEENNLSTPLKSFFGNITKRNLMQKKEPSIIIYDQRININQMRVLYNAMKYPVTYVQGPPGTGKTQTIINVVLSGFYNDKTMLICSSNNKPVDGIIEKLLFTYRKQKINFPFLRLGNNEEIAKTTKVIYDLSQYETNKVVKENLINEIKDNADEDNKKLLQLLLIQEKRCELEDKLYNAKKLVDSFDNQKSKVITNIEKTVVELKKQLEELPIITNEMVLELFRPLKDDYKLSQYLFFKSLSYIQKLKYPRYAELTRVCSIKDDESRVKEFNRWLSDFTNMKLLMEAFPVIFSTNISAKKLGKPINQFDLVIMDEAGQCNIATALIPIVRAKNLLLVGDVNQLRPVIVMTESMNKTLMNRYEIAEDYNYKSKSILDVMIERDNISKYILLRYHYRCGRKIINYSNMRYYNNNLNLDFLNKDGELKLIDVKNNHIELKNTAFDEAKAIIDYVQRNELKDVVIITPFINQKDLINAMLRERGIDNVRCGTIHTTQGAESDTIIFSPAISLKSSRSTYNWIKNNHELINVAVTRAKNKFIVAGDMEAIKAHSNGDDDLYNLCQYVIKKGEIKVPPSKNIKIEIGMSNGSKYEDMFFETVSHFCTVHRRFEAERNVYLRKLFKDDKRFVNTKYEFDAVLYEVDAYGKKGKPLIVFEVNGGEHFGNVKREQSDKLKINVCKEKGIKIVFIPNSFVKAYEYIVEVINDSKDGLFDNITLF